MRTRRFGPTQPTQIDLPVIGLGTWQMERDDRASAIAALQRGLELGMTHVDTAEMYGNGHVEELVGEALAGRRDGVYLVSKVLPSNATRTGTVAACERSLRRLGTDHLDLYLLHWPGTHPIEGTIAAFEALVEAGKIRAWGVSNFDEDQLAEVIAIAGAGRCACNQVLYHLGERAIEHELIAACEQHEVAVVAYSPLGAGRFPAPQSKGGRVLTEIGAAHGATPHAVAIAFLLRRESVFAIPKTARVEHVAQLAGAADIALTDDEVARIERVFPLRPHRLGVPML